MLAGIESGGTKTVCAVGSSPPDLVMRSRVPTSDDPVDTLARVADLLVEASGGGRDLEAIGIGSFGPCDPDPGSPTYGHVLSTPKPGWRDVDVVGILRGLLVERGVTAAIPVAFDTDVNAAALAEWRYGAAAGDPSVLYLTVGTGIGGGAVLRGGLLHGLLHPEMGHLRIPRPDHEASVFAGVCPYHGDCWEGVASGPAMEARWGRPAEDLPADHPAWDLEAACMAAGLHALVCVLSPQRVVVGGGVGTVPHLLPRVRPLLLASLAGYLDVPAIVSDIEAYVVPAKLGGNAGVIGALALAEAALA